MQVRCICLLAAVALLATQSILPAQKAAAKKAIIPFNTQYITKDFVAAALSHPNRIFASRTVQNALKELETVIGKKAVADGLAEAEKDLGVPPDQVRQFMILLDRDFVKRSIGPRSIGAIRPRPALIVRYTGRVNQRAVLKPFFGDPQRRQKEREPPRKPPEKKSHAGKTYLRIPGVKRLHRDGVLGSYLGACFVDDKTLIIAEEELLKRMLTAKGVDTPLTRRLSRLGTQPEAMLVVSGEPFAKLAATVPRKAIPPFLANLPDLATKLESLVITVRLDGKTLLSGVAEMRDEKSAETFTNLLSKVLVPMFKGGFKAEREASERGAPNVVKTMFATLNELIESVQVTRSKRDVVVSLPRPKRLEDLPKIFVPALQAARQNSLRTVRRRKLKEITLAMHQFHEAHDRFPGASSDAKGKDSGLSWRVHLLPYLEQQALYVRFKLDEPWDSAHNKRLIAQMPDVFISHGVKQPGKTAIHVLVGNGAPFQKKGPGPRFGDILDGAKNTLFAVEAGADKAEAWTKPGGLPFGMKKKPREMFGKPIRGGYLGVFFDGRVRWLSINIHVENLQNLIRHQDGNVVLLPDP